MTKILYIPGEIANAAIDEHGNRKPVTRTHHIFDDTKNKNQAEINAEVDDTFALHQSEINALNSQNYVTVDSFSSLPTTGAVDTVYRVSNWDGTQQDPSVYSEYAWNGEDYVHLSTKTQIGEVFDISAYHATGGELAKYADLAAALGTNGANIPDALRKGGMSVKFVLSSDNKYVQARLMLSTFTVAQFTNINNWQVIDATPTKNSKNLVESGGVFKNEQSLRSIQDSLIKPLYVETEDDISGWTTLASGITLKKGVTYRFTSTRNVPATSSTTYFYISDKSDGTGTNIITANIAATKTQNQVYYTAEEDIEGLYMIAYGYASPVSAQLETIDYKGLQLLTGDVNSISSNLPFKVELTLGYIDNNGVVTNSGLYSDWYHTDYIRIDSILGDNIFLSRGCNGNVSYPSAAAYAVYDENKTPVYISSNGNASILKTSLPSSAYYIAFTFYMPSALVDVSIYNYFVNDKIKTNYNALKDLSNRGIERVLDNGITLINGYVKDDGTVVDEHTYGYWKRTDFINIDNIIGSNIILSTASNGNTSSHVAGYVTFDSNKGFLSMSEVGVKSVEKSSIPINAKYIMFSFYNIGNNKVYIERYNLSDIEDETLNGRLKLFCGYVRRNGTVVDLQNYNALWARTDYISVDRVAGYKITLSVSCNGDDNSSIAGCVAFNENKEHVKIWNNGFIHLNKDELPANTKYLMFSFFNKKEVKIENYSVKDIANSAFNASVIPQDCIEEEEKDNLRGSLIFTGLFNFIHTSDTHIKASNVKCFENVLSLAQEDYIDCVVHTGDIIWDVFSDSIEPFNSALIGNTKDLIMCVGNHDVGGNSKNPAQCGTDLQVFNKFYSPYIDETYHLGGENKPYYYKDYADYNIRFISLYQYNSDMAMTGDELTYERGDIAFRQDEIDWFINTLLSTPSGYTIFVLAHAPETTGAKTDDWQSLRLANQIFTSNHIITDILIAYKNRQSINNSYIQTSNVVATINAVADFSSASAYIAGFLNGHTHDDFIGKDESGQINIINKNCDNLEYQTGTSIYKFANTYNENTINVVSVDTSRRIIAVYRVGGKYSKWGDFRNVKTLTY